MRSLVNSLNEPLCVRPGEHRARRYHACRVLHDRRNVTHKVSGHIARINFNYAAIPRMIMRTVIRRDCICPIRSTRATGAIDLVEKQLPICAK